MDVYVQYVHTYDVNLNSSVLLTNTSMNVGLF